VCDVLKAVVRNAVPAIFCSLYRSPTPVVSCLYPKTLYIAFKPPTRPFRFVFSTFFIRARLQIKACKLCRQLFSRALLPTRLLPPCIGTFACVVCARSFRWVLSSRVQCTEKEFLPSVRPNKKHERITCSAFVFDEIRRRRRLRVSRFQ